MNNKQEYIKAYNKANYKQVVLRLHKDNDNDILTKLEQVNSKNGYIKQLIRDDIERN